MNTSIEKNLNHSSSTSFRSSFFSWFSEIPFPFLSLLLQKLLDKILKKEKTKNATKFFVAMKLPPSELPVGKPQPRRKSSRLAPLIALIILLTIPLYFPSIIRDSSKILFETSTPYAELEDPITLISHVEAPKSENAKDPCSTNSAQCHDGDKAADHRVAPVRKKREKVVLIDSKCH